MPLSDISRLAAMSTSKPEVPEGAPAVISMRLWEGRSSSYIQCSLYFQTTAPTTYRLCGFLCKAAISKLPEPLELRIVSSRRWAIMLWLNFCTWFLMSNFEILPGWTVGRRLLCEKIRCSKYIDMSILQSWVSISINSYLQLTANNYLAYWKH
jgi:hypothetical protein